MLPLVRHQQRGGHAHRRSWRFAIVGLSVGIITGLGGQLSLGQFAVGAVGAVVSYHVSEPHRRTSRWRSCTPASAAPRVSLLIGLPALRIKGLLLTVTTLGFALVTPSWLLQQPWVLGDGVDPGRPIVFGDAARHRQAATTTSSSSCSCCMLLLARNVRRGGFGRLLVAVRDNEDNARAFTVPRAAA